MSALLDIQDTAVICRPGIGHDAKGLIPGRTPAMNGNDDPFCVDRGDPMPDQKDPVMTDGLYGRAGLFRESVPGFDPRFEKGIVLYKPSDTLWGGALLGRQRGSLEPSIVRGVAWRSRYPRDHCLGCPG